MRILALVTDAYGRGGGIAQFNRNMFKALDGIPECRQVVVFPRHWERSGEPLPSAVDLRPRSAGSKARFVRVLAAALFRDRSYDLVVCGHINLILLSYLVSRICRAPMLLIVHGIEAWSPTRSGLTRKAIEKTDMCVSVSQLTLDRFLKWSKLERSRCQVIPNTFDAGRFCPGERSAELLRRYGLSSPEQGNMRSPNAGEPRADQRAANRIILTVARLAASERYKGIDEVLEVFPELVRRHPDLVYLIVGDGDDRERLRRHAEELGIAENVRFVGWIDEDEKVDHYRLADAFVMPGRGEGFGIVYLEAMACGVPVVGSVLDGSREALRGGELGILVNPDDHIDLIAGIETALDRQKGVPKGLETFGFGKFSERLRAVVNMHDPITLGSQSNRRNDPRTL